MQTLNGVHPDKVDLLGQLPVRQATAREYQKDEVIYVPDSVKDLRVHLVQEGRIIIKAYPNSGVAVGLEMLDSEEVFGLEALVGSYTTLAKCAQFSRILSWDVVTLDQLQRSNALLAVGLLQSAIRRSVYFQRRIEEFASMKIQERIATFLIEKADRKKASGPVEEDGGVTLPPMTHEVISEFVGTSREIVTHYMNLFSRAGYTTHNRRAIRIFNTAGFAGWVSANTDHLDVSFHEAGER